MLGIADKQALSNMSMVTNMVWQEVKADSDKRSKSWIGMTDLEVLNRMKHIRHKVRGKDIFRKIEQPHVSKMKDSHFWFLRFNMTLIDPETNELHRMIGFGNPELFPLLNGKVHLCVDGTFLCVPHLLSQIIALMTHDVQK